MIIDTTQSKIERQLQQRVDLGSLFYVPMTIGMPHSFSHIAHRIAILHYNNLEIARLYISQPNDINWFPRSICENQLIKSQWIISKTLPENESLLECIVSKRPCPKLCVSADVVSEYTCTDHDIWRWSGVRRNWELNRLEIDIDYLVRMYWGDIKSGRRQASLGV